MKVHRFPIDPEGRYLLVLETERQIDRQHADELVRSINAWWESGKPLLLVNIVPGEQVRLERIGGADAPSMEQKP